MSYAVYFHEDTRTIEIKGTGTATTSATLDLIAGLGDSLRSHPGYDLLYDTTALQIQSSASDMVKVAEALFDNTGAEFGRIALVIPDARKAFAMMFTALANQHDIDASVFTDVYEAREWLGLPSL